jgi:hypothetical protein
MWVSLAEGRAELEAGRFTWTPDFRTKLEPKRIKKTRRRRTPSSKGAR